MLRDVDCRVRTFVLLLALSAGALGAAAAPAAAQTSPTPKPAPKLELVGGTEEARTIALRLMGTGGERRLEGVLHLVVRNPGDEQAVLRLRYARTDGQRLETLPGRSKVIALGPSGAPGSARLQELGSRAAPLVVALATAPTAQSRKAALGLVRILRRVGGAAEAGSASADARALAKALRLAVRAPDRAGTAAVVARRLRRLLRAGSGAPVLTTADIAPFLAALRRLSTGAGAEETTAALTRFATLAGSRRRPVVPAGGIRQIDLVFTLPASRPPADLAGHIALEAIGAPAAEVSVPVTAQARAVSGAKFEPEKVVVQVTRWCPAALCPMRGEEDLRIVGPGSGDALEDIIGAGLQGSSVVLRSDGGGRVEAELGPLEPDAGAAGIIDAPLILKDEAPPGTYTGDLPLSRFATDAPALPVEVNSRLWFPWAVLFIFLGVVAAGMLTHHMGLRRRKKLLRDWLRSAVEGDLRRARELNAAQGRDERLLWDLDIPPTLADDPKWQYFSELTNANSIFTAVRWARNDADLDEAQEAARDLVLQIKSWSTAVKAVHALWEEGRKTHAARHTLTWEDTNTAKHTRLLLRGARRPPRDQADADQRLDQLERQTRWHNRYGEAWDLWLRAFDRDPERVQAFDIEKLDEGLPPIATRTDAQQDELEDTLERGVQMLHEVLEEPDEVPSIAGAKAIRAMRGELGVLRTSAGTTAMLCQVDSNTARAERPAFAAASSMGSKVGDAIRHPMRTLALSDALLSGVIILMTSLVYALTIYDASWGSVGDVATAFVAGFAGQVLVKWALLPAYRSVRMRAEQAADAAEPGTALASFGKAAGA